MPYAFGGRNRSVHFALTLILGAFILSFLFYRPELDTDAENFSTEGLNIKHQLTMPTPIVPTVEHLRFPHNALDLEYQAPTPSPAMKQTGPSQTMPEATRHSHAPSLVDSSNKTMVASDRTCIRPYKVKKGETINDITRSQSVATLELLSENGLTFPLEGPLTAGSDLCLPKKCTLAHLSDDQTCRNFGAEALAQREVLAWNPSAAKGLESGSLCSGLEVIGGVQICMSEPGKEMD